MHMRLNGLGMLIALWTTLAPMALAGGDPFADIDAAIAAKRDTDVQVTLQQLAETDDPRVRGMALSRLTLGALKQGMGLAFKAQISESVALLRQVPGAELELARALLWASEVAAAEDDNQTRLQLGEEALRLFESQPGAELELMRALLRVSNADGRLDRGVEGAAKVARAAAIADRFGAAPIERVAILGRQGAFAYASGDLDSAEGHYAQMLALAGREAPDTLEHASALANVALVRAERGQLAAARSGYLQAIAMRKTAGSRSQMIATDLTTLGEIELRLGEREAALTHLLEARERLQALQSRSEIHVMLLLKLAALSFDQGDRPRALTWFEEADEMARALPFTCACKAKTLVGLAWFHLESAAPDRALALYRQAIDVLAPEQADPLTAAHAWAGEAEALLALGKATEATAALEHALPKLIELAPNSAQHARLIWLQGRGLQANGAVDAAREHFCRASRMLDRASLQAIDDAGQARFRREYAKVYRDCIEATAAAGDAAAVFDGLERLRLRRASGDAAPETHVVLTLDALRQQMPADAVFLSYLVGARQTQLLAISQALPPQLLQLPVGAADLERSVSSFRERILDRVDEHDAPLRHEAAALYRTLLRPAAASIKGKRQLVVAPDAALHDLPWAALRQGRHWLIQTHALVIADTLSDRAPARPSVTGVLGVADASDSHIPEGVLRDGTSQLPALPHSREEVAELKRMQAKADVLIGADATEASVRQRLPQARWAHFAVHAWLNGARPLESALLLHGTDGSASNDGQLRAQEIGALALAADVVVLSGCDTGRGGELGGVGLLGLVRAFRSAGTDRVVASLWSIDDRGTAELFERHYRSGDTDIVRGWQRTQQSALLHPRYRGGNDQHRGVGALTPSRSHPHLLPYHWASLQVYGRPW